MSENQLPNSEHLTPREKVEQMQAAFDMELEHILEELQVWNLGLEVAYIEDQETGAETHLELARDAKNNLDEQWSYHDDWVMISGYWDINRAMLSNTGIINNVIHDEPVFSPALSNGFEVKARENKAPIVGFSFKVGTMMVINEKLYGRLTSLAFVKQESASLSLARKSAELGSPKETLIEAVHFYDDLLQLYTHRPSNFYQKSAEVQQRFFESLIDGLTEAITIPSYATLCREVEVPYVYRRGQGAVYDGGGLSLEYIKQGETDITLTGAIKGVTILESLYATDTPLRSKDDLIDPDAGICFVVSVSEGTIREDQVDERDFIVPARLIKELNIVIR